jgi:hypothetical protein
VPTAVCGTIGGESLNAPTFERIATVVVRPHTVLNYCSFDTHTLVMNLMIDAVSSGGGTSSCDSELEGEQTVGCLQQKFVPLRIKIAVFTLRYEMSCVARYSSLIFKVLNRFLGWNL